MTDDRTLDILTSCFDHVSLLADVTAAHLICSNVS